MSLNGIDISRWQTGINLSAINGLDFSICKATQGTSYAQSYIDEFHKQIKACQDNGILYGAYHYINGSGAKAEAEYFLNTVNDYLYKAVLCIDWEKAGNSAWQREDYLEELGLYIQKQTGVKPIVYASHAYFPWDVCQDNGWGEWVAQYATTTIVNGFQSNPWNEGAYSCSIRQYSGNGRLSGYSSAIDLDKAYMTREAWGRYANPKGTSQAGKPETPVEVDSGTYHIEGDITITKK